MKLLALCTFVQSAGGKAPKEMPLCGVRLSFQQNQFKKIRRL
jgi:hypothetical protein